VTAGAFRAHALVKKFYAGLYEAPKPPQPVEPVAPIKPVVVPSVKRITPIRGKNAMYGFEDDVSIPKQASLKEYFGIPVKK
jgi:hypothetical protein